MQVEEVQKDILSRLSNIETMLYSLSRGYPQIPLHSMSQQETGAGVTFQWPVQTPPAIQPPAVQPPPEQVDHPKEHLSEPPPCTPPSCTPPSSNSGLPYYLKDPKQAIIEPLPSSEINRIKLRSVEEMLETEGDLTKQESAAGTLAQIWPRKHFLGRK